MNRLINDIEFAIDELDVIKTCVYSKFRLFDVYVAKSYTKEIEKILCRIDEGMKYITNSKKLDEKGLRGYVEINQDIVKIRIKAVSRRGFHGYDERKYIISIHDKFTEDMNLSDIINQFYELIKDAKDTINCYYLCDTDSFLQLLLEALKSLPNDALRKYNRLYKKSIR